MELLDIACHFWLKYVKLCSLWDCREDYYQEGNHVHARLKVLEAYKRALSTWARWVDKNLDGSRTQIFFRGYSATHFRYNSFLHVNLARTLMEDVMIRNSTCNLYVAFLWY